KIDKISQRILLKADESVNLGFAAKAVRLYTEAGRLPLGPEKRADVEKRLSGATDLLAKSRHEYDDRLQKAREALAKGDAGEAYLEIADRYFAKQDLESAIPYFRRVLKLEPDNIRAREAIKMYDNLERIRQERNEVR